MSNNTPSSKIAAPSPEEARKRLEPFVRWLEGRTVVLQDRITRLVRITDVRTDHGGWNATAISLARIHTRLVDGFDMDVFGVSFPWTGMFFSGGVLHSDLPGVWAIFWNPDLIERVGQMLAKAERSVDYRTLHQEIGVLLREHWTSGRPPVPYAQDPWSAPPAHASP